MGLGGPRGSLAPGQSPCPSVGAWLSPPFLPLKVRGTRGGDAGLAGKGGVRRAGGWSFRWSLLVPLLSSGDLPSLSCNLGTLYRLREQIHCIKCLTGYSPLLETVQTAPFVSPGMLLGGGQGEPSAQARAAGPCAACFHLWGLLQAEPRPQALPHSRLSPSPADVPPAGGQREGPARLPGRRPVWKLR